MPSQAPHATNAHRVNVTPLDYTAEGAPTIMTAHGLSLAVGDKTIGRVTSWTPQAYARSVEHAFELNNRTFGRPVDAVPGSGSGYTIAMSRTEMWNDEIEISLGFDLWTDLVDQTRPFSITEFLFRGSSLYRAWEYTGCWLTDRNIDGYQSEGDPSVKVTANITYVGRTRKR